MWFNDVALLIINRVEAYSVSPQGIESMCVQRKRELVLHSGPYSLFNSLGTQYLNPVYTSLQGLYIPKAEAKVDSHLPIIFITLEESIYRFLLYVFPHPKWKISRECL